ncbi:MAG TPA: J domain-containing protein [bacterium]|nr:J domain-containing protein [bacterium]HOL47162.1 J domain-containing protein [bacterium]HPQ18085.1 J domain-containing protein [bacterium]
MEKVDSNITYYCEILSIHTATFTLDDVKKAYRECVLKYHPDTNPDNELLNKKFAQIVKAYKYLEKYCRELKSEIDNYKKSDFEKLKNKYVKDDREIKDYEKNRIKINNNYNTNNNTNNFKENNFNEPILQPKKRIKINDINFSKYLFKNRLLDYRKKFFSKFEEKKNEAKIIINNSDVQLSISEIMLRLTYSDNYNVKLYCIKELGKSNSRVALWALIKQLNSETLPFTLKKEILKILRKKSSIFFKSLIRECQNKINNIIVRKKILQKV